MDEEKRYEGEAESGTEGGRSPSGGPDPEGMDVGELDWARAGIPGEERIRVPRLGVSTKGRKLVRKEEPGRAFTPEERLLLLDTWRRSKLPVKDFAVLVSVSPQTLKGWESKFEDYGPGGLVDKARGGPRGSKVLEVTKRAILMMKESNPDWGCQRISGMLLRGPALPAGNPVAGVHRDRGVLGPRGRAAEDRVVHRLLQLPGTAPGDRRGGAGGPVFWGSGPPGHWLEISG